MKKQAQYIALHVTTKEDLKKAIDDNEPVIVVTNVLYKIIKND